MVNSKQKEGNARKEAKKESLARDEIDKKEEILTKDWEKGSKNNSKKLLEEEKKLEQIRKKLEKDNLNRVDEILTESIKKPNQRQDKKSIQKELKINSFDNGKVESFSASGLDQALEMMEVVEAGTMAKQQDKIERHPERRVKAGWMAFQESQMPILKAENPKLRLSQLNQMLQKMWEKSPSNPMNQASISHTTSRETEREIINDMKQKRQDMLN